MDINSNFWTKREILQIGSRVCSICSGLHWLSTNLYDVLADAFSLNSSARDLDNPSKDKAKSLLDLFARRFSILRNSDLFYICKKLSSRRILVKTHYIRIAHNTLHNSDFLAQHQDEEVR